MQYHAEADRQTLVRSYPKLTDVSADLRTLAQNGWQVEDVEHPDTTHPWLVPICILRRVSTRHRYRVTYVRRRPTS